jgi:ribosomal protein S18 acetylase RimI-like enzyme
MEVREVRDDEADIAGDLVVAAYRAIEGTPPVDDDGYGAELRAVAERARNSVVFVVVEGGRLLGCVTYVPDETSPMAEDLQAGEAGIRMLAVDPAGQRRGVGRALVDECVARARAEGKARLFLHSGAWMVPAHALYEALGFRRVPERDWLPEPDIPLLAFAIDLAPPAFSQGRSRRTGRAGR